MLRTIAIRNELTLRGFLSNGIRSKEVLRLLSTQAAARRQIFRLSNFEIRKPKEVSVWRTNFVRNFADLPSHIKVALPALSPTMSSGTIVSWEKKEGDKLNEGDLLAEIETDKATMGFETPEEGYLAKILVKAGTKDVPIGKLVCIIVEKAEHVAAFKDFVDDGSSAPPPKKAGAPAAAAPAPAAAAPARAPAAPAAAPAAPAAAASDGKRVYASPMAKNLANAQKLRLEGKGSGVFGSIKSQDLAGMKAPAAGHAPAPAAGGKPGKPGKAGPPAANPYIDVPVTNMRAVIAKRLKESKQQIPHYYVSVEIVVDKLLKFREATNKKLEKKKIKVSVNDFIIKATAIACRKVPATNSYWMDNVIRQFENVDVSVAVSTPGGLITPIIFSADRKGVIDISNEVKELAGRARQNKLKPHEFQGGTVSVSNLGMYGVSDFCAVVNPPQSCILAIGTTVKKLVADPKSENGFKEVNVLKVTLSSDHRTVDGALAAEWLQHFSQFMTDPASMIL